jgi:hypothetical protein
MEKFLFFLTLLIAIPKLIDAIIFDALGVG